jgi:hypothetical protein
MRERLVWSSLSGPVMQPLVLTLKGIRGIRDGLGLDEITLDLERLADGAQLIAIAGANGSKTTVMDSLSPFIGPGPDGRRSQGQGSELLV